MIEIFQDAEIAQSVEHFTRNEEILYIKNSEFKAFTGFEPKKLPQFLPQLQTYQYNYGNKKMAEEYITQLPYIFIIKFCSLYF